MLFKEVRNHQYWLNGRDLIYHVQGPEFIPRPCNEEDEECMRTRREIPISVAYKTTNSQSHPQKNA